MLLIPSLKAPHQRVLAQRLTSVRRLVQDAQHLRGIDLVVVVAPKGQAVTVSLFLGLDAVLLVAEVEPVAAALTALRPWVPILVGEEQARGIAFARTVSAC